MPFDYYRVSYYVAKYRVSLKLRNSYIIISKYHSCMNIMESELGLHFIYPVTQGIKIN